MNVEPQRALSGKWNFSTTLVMEQMSRLFYWATGMLILARNKIPNDKMQPLCPGIPSCLWEEWCCMADGNTSINVNKTIQNSRRVARWGGCCQQLRSDKLPAWLQPIWQYSMGSKAAGVERKVDLVVLYFKYLLGKVLLIRNCWFSVIFKLTLQWRPKHPWRNPVKQQQNCTLKTIF